MQEVSIPSEISIDSDRVEQTVPNVKTNFDNKRNHSGARINNTQQIIQNSKESDRLTKDYWRRDSYPNATYAPPNSITDKNPPTFAGLNSAISQDKHPQPHAIALEDDSHNE